MRLMNSARHVIVTVLAALVSLMSGEAGAEEAVFPGKTWKLKQPKDLADMVSGYGLPEKPGAAWAYNDSAINLYSKTLFDGVIESTI